MSNLDTSKGGVMSDQKFQVVCDEYKSHPTSYGQALALLEAINEEPRQCPLEHTVVPYVSRASLLLTEPPTEHDNPGDRDVVSL
jgi:hypothetical protein